MKHEFFKSQYGYYNFRTTDGKPTEEMTNELKKNGWRWSRFNNCWYPASSDAKDVQTHEKFVSSFTKKYLGADKLPEEKKTRDPSAHTGVPADITTLEQVVKLAFDDVITDEDAKKAAQRIHDNIRDSIVDERIAHFETLVTELQEKLREDQEKIEKLENELAWLTDTDKDLSASQEQEQLDAEAEYQRENTLTEEEEQDITGRNNVNGSVTGADSDPDGGDTGESAAVSAGEGITISGEAVMKAMDMIARAEFPEAEKTFEKNKDEGEVIVTAEELKAAKSVLPMTQYVTTLQLSQGEEGNWFKQKIKDIAAAVSNAPKFGQTDGAEQHPIIMRYFHPSYTETLVTEIGEDGEAYGFQCLNGDYEMAEWGYLDLNEIKSLRGMEMDYHVPDGMTVERWLYQEHPEEFPQYAEYDVNKPENTDEPEPTLVGADSVTADEIEAEKSLIQEKIQQLKEELKSDTFVEDAEDKSIQELYIEKLESFTDDDIKAQILWKKENERRNEERHAEVVEHYKEEAQRRATPQDGNLLSFNDTNPVFTLTNKETGRQITIQPTGNLSKNVQHVGKLSTLGEAVYVIDNIRALGFDIYSTESRIVVFNNDKFYDFDTYRDSGEFNLATENFEFDLNNKRLNDWDFVKYISGGLKITKRMKEFEKIEAVKTESPEYDFTQPVNISDRFAVDFVKRIADSEPVVRFIDREYNQITTGSYYISTIIGHKKGAGLALDGSVPEWSVDAEAMLKAISICEYYKNNNISVTSKFAGGQELSDDMSSKSGTDNLDYIDSLNSEQANNRANELGYYFEYNDDEKTCDIHRETDGDWVGSYSEGGFGYASDIMDDGINKIPDSIFREVTSLAEQFFHKYREEHNLSRNEAELDITKEQPAGTPFDRVTKDYGEKYKEFFDTYEKLKEAFIENESRYVGNARVRRNFEQVHDELLKLQVQELRDIIKESATIEEASENAVRYFNAFGNDGLTSNNLYLLTGIGSYKRQSDGFNSTSYFTTSAEKMKEYIQKEFEESHRSETKETTKQWSYFVRDTAEFEQFWDFSPITNLSAKEAVAKYAELQDKGFDCGIGIYIPGDLVFDDPSGEGAHIFTRYHRKDDFIETFRIYGDTFIDNLKERGERAEKYIKAYEELYHAALDISLDVEVPKFLFMKTQRLYHKPSLSYDFDVRGILDDLLEAEFATLDMNVDVWNDLISQGADARKALKTAAEDANLGDNLNWLLDNLPESTVREYFSDKEYADSVFNIAKDSVTHDRGIWSSAEDIGINGFLRIAELCGRKDEAAEYHRLLLREEGWDEPETQSVENDVDYAYELADWIIQRGLEESDSQENCIITYDEILENTDTPEEWLRKNYALVNVALKSHDDNELLEYNPEENIESDTFNLYFCTNSDEMGENTLFKFDEKKARWVRKTEEELREERQTEPEPEPALPFDVVTDEMYMINGHYYTSSRIEQEMEENLQAVFRELVPEPYIGGVKVYGNPEKDGKIKILVQYGTNELEGKWREDALFDAIAEEHLTFDGMEVDVNPITPEKSGTIDEYMERLEKLGSEAAEISRDNESAAQKPLPVRTIFTAEPFGTEANIFMVETDLRRGIPAYDIVGIRDDRVKEAREIIRAALKNSGLNYHGERILQSVSPADLRKDGDTEALAMAADLLNQSGSGVYKGEDVLILGGLELSGSIRPVRGVAPMVAKAVEKGIKDIIVPSQNVAEAQAIPGASVVGVSSLRELHDILSHSEPFLEQKTVITRNDGDIVFNDEYLKEYSGVSLDGYYDAARAIEIAVAGRHNILLGGAPGSGKTLLADYLIPALSPALTNEESIETTRIHSVAGILRPDEVAVKFPPIRMPHNSASIEGMCGGGTELKPGEISLADNGTLILDDAPEFRSSVLQMLRVPIDNGSITLSRAGRSAALPAKFQLAMTANPCPCGNYGSDGKVCICSQHSIDMYNAKYMKPLGARVEIKQIVSRDEKDTRKTTIEEMRRHVENARKIQLENGTYNSRLDIETVRRGLNDDCAEYISYIYEKSGENGLDSKQERNMLVVALTIANMDGRKEIALDDLREAVELTFPLYEKPHAFRREPDAIHHEEEHAPGRKLDNEPEVHRQPPAPSKKDIKRIREKCREILDKYDNTHLTQEEKDYVAGMESEPADRHQVEASFRRMKYVYITEKDSQGNWLIEKGQVITGAEARKMLSVPDFMSAVDRASFHFNSGRNTADGGYIYFDDGEPYRSRAVKPYELTQEDISALSHYEGGGGLDEKNRSADAVLNEFYTPDNLIAKVWKIVDAYAPDAKTVLEPSAGTGKFANGRPNNIFTMHELDETSARINRIFHPDANVIQGAYQEQFFDENGIARLRNYVQPKYDIVIGNPPYGAYKDEWHGKGEGKEFDRYEEYFIAKGLEALKDENSLIAFVVPSGFLNSVHDKAKESICEKGELIDAYRLPEGTFPTTEVGTDIIIMRSWAKIEKEFKEQYGEIDLFDLINTEKKERSRLLSYNQWFKEHPERILGEIKTRRNRFGREEEYVARHDGMSVQDELDKIDVLLTNSPVALVFSTPDKALHESSSPAETGQAQFGQKAVPEEEVRAIFAETYPDNEERANKDAEKFISAWNTKSFDGLVSGLATSFDEVPSLRDLFSSVEGVALPDGDSYNTLIWLANNYAAEDSVPEWCRFHSWNDALIFAVKRRARPEIQDFFRKHTSATERAGFLKKTYNLSGGGWFGFNDDWFSGKGCKINAIIDGRFKDKSFTWSEISNAVADLIRDGNYLPAGQDKEFIAEVEKTDSDDYKKNLVNDYLNLVKNLANDGSDEHLDFLSERWDSDSPTVAEVLDIYLPKYINGEELFNLPGDEARKENLALAVLFTHFGDIKNILLTEDRYGGAAGFLDDREQPIENFDNEDDYYAQPIAADILKDILYGFEKEVHVMNNLEWLVNVHGCELNNTKSVLDKLYDKFPASKEGPYAEAFERSKIIDIAFGERSYEKLTLPRRAEQQNTGELDFDSGSLSSNTSRLPGVQWKVTEEDLDKVFGIYDDNLDYDYHTVWDRCFAALNGMPKEDVARLRIWDYSDKKEHVFSTENIKTSDQPLSVALDESFTFDGVTYYGRVVHNGRSELEKDILIFDEALSSVLMPYLGGDGDMSGLDEELINDATAIDEQIYCYVPKEVLQHDDEYILRWCAENSIDIEGWEKEREAAHGHPVFEHASTTEPIQEQNKGGLRVLLRDDVLDQAMINRLHTTWIRQNEANAAPNTSSVEISNDFIRLGIKPGDTVMGAIEKINRFRNKGFEDAELFFTVGEYTGYSVEPMGEFGDRLNLETLREFNRRMGIESVFRPGFRNDSFEANYVTGHDAEFRYKLLSRMKSDCDYYLEHEKNVPNALFGGNPDEHIDNMISLYRSFGIDNVPDWLTVAEFREYTIKMTGRELFDIIDKNISLAEHESAGAEINKAAAPNDTARDNPETTVPPPEIPYVIKAYDNVISASDGSDFLSRMKTVLNMPVLKLSAVNNWRNFYKYESNMSVVFNVDTRESVLYHSSWNDNRFIIAHADADGIITPLFDQGSDAFTKLTPSQKDKLNKALDFYKDDIDNLLGVYAGYDHSTGIVYLRDFKNNVRWGFGNNVFYNPDDGSVFEPDNARVRVAAFGISFPSAGDTDFKQPNYDYDPRDLDKDRDCGFFYASFDAIYAGGGIADIDRIKKEDEAIRAETAPEIYEIPLDEEELTYSDSCKRYEEQVGIMRKAMLSSSNLTEEEWTNKAGELQIGILTGRNERRLALSAGDQRTQDANLVLSAILKQPFSTARSFEAGAAEVSYVKNGGGVDVYIDGSKSFTVNENMKTLVTYNNYFVTDTFVKTLYERFGNQLTVSDEDYNEPKRTSLDSIIASKNIESDPVICRDIAQFALSSEFKGEGGGEVRRNFGGLSVSRSSAGVNTMLYIGKNNDILLKYNRKDNILHLYQAAYDNGLISGIQKEFEEHTERLSALIDRLSVIKSVEIDGTMYFDDNGRTVTNPSVRRNYDKPAAKKLMSSDDFAATYGASWNPEERVFWEATDYAGYIDLARLSPDDQERLRNSPNYYEETDSRFIHKVLFLSGNIYEKIDINEDNFVNERLSEDSYRRNKLALEHSIPAPFKLNDISVPVKSSFVKDFEIDGMPLQEIFLQWATGCNIDDSPNTRDSIEDFAQAAISREDIPFGILWSDVVDYIDGKPVRVPQDIDDEDKRAEIRNEKTNARKLTAQALFDRFLRQGLTQEQQDSYVLHYNRTFNNNVEADYSKLPLFVDGMNMYRDGKKFTLYEQQIKGVAALSNKGNGLLAYDVGVGKTAAGIVATVNQIQTARSTRPLIVVPKSVIKSWEHDIRELFPDYTLNVLGAMGAKDIAGYYDGNHGLNIPPDSITLCTPEALSNITFKRETISIQLLGDFIDLMGVNDKMSSTNARERAEAKKKVLDAIGGAGTVKNGNYVFFENTGFDHITVDEAHRFKNLFKVPRPKKGETNEFSAMGTGEPSKRAMKMFAITQYIQKNNNNRNVFMLTATPFTNSPLEIYSMLSYIARKELEDRGIKDLYAFCEQYANTRLEQVVTHKNSIEYSAVMKEFSDVQGLQNILKKYIDKVDAEEALVIRPDKVNHPVYLQPTKLQQEIFDFAHRVMEYIPEKGEKRAPVLEGMNIINKAALSPATLSYDQLIDPFTKEPSGILIPGRDEIVTSSPKLKTACDTVVTCWKEKPDCGQIIYMNIGKEFYPDIQNYMEKQGVPRNVFAIIDGTDVTIGGKKIGGGADEARDYATGCFNDIKNPCKIIIGSSAISEGMNLNGNSISLYNLTLGWNPSESVQVTGRIHRQGNKQGNVHIVFPLLEDSCDPFLYQKHDEKSSRINDLFSYRNGGKMDVDEINPEDAKFALIKDPRTLAKFEITKEVSDLSKEKAVYESQVKDYDALVTNRVKYEAKLKERTENKETYIRNYQESLFKGNARTEEEQAAGIARHDKAINDCKTMLKNIGSKLKAMGINSEDDAAIFSQNAARKIRGIDAEISALTSPEHVKEVTEAWNLKLMEERVIKSNRAHTGHLADSILNNLYPFSVTEERVQKERWVAAQKYRDTDPERFAKAKEAWEKYQEKKSGPTATGGGTGAERETPVVSGSGNQRPAQEVVPAREAVENEEEKKRKLAVPSQSQSGSGQLSFF